jgi:hypothetical protein
VTAVQRGVVVAGPDRQAIAVRAEAAEGRGVRLCERGVGVIESAECPRARADGFNRAIGKRPGH